MAAEARVSRESMRRVVKHDHRMTPYKLQSRQLLNTSTMDKRFKRAKLLLNQLKAAMLPSIIWTDEKICTVQATHNTQND